MTIQNLNRNQNEELAKLLIGAALSGLLAFVGIVMLKDAGGPAKRGGGR